MPQKIYKNELIKEINQKIKMCETYQQQNPDIVATQHVAQAEKNPCGDNKFYVNLLLKSPGIFPIINDFETIEKNGKVYKHDFLLKNIEEGQFIGCIITYDIKGNSYKSKEYKSPTDLLMSLISLISSKEEEKKVKIAQIYDFNPKDDFFSSNVFENDKKIAEKENFDKIFYAIGSFKFKENFDQIIKSDFESDIKKNQNSIISNKLASLCKSNKNDVNNIKFNSPSINNLSTLNIFEAVPSNFEEKIYRTTCDFKNVTQFSERRDGAKNGNLKNALIFDFGNYFKKIYENFSKQFNKNQDRPTKSRELTLYELFKGFLSKSGAKIIGNYKEAKEDDEKIKQIKEVENQFNIFKSKYKKDDDFTKIIDANNQFKQNMIAFEKSEMIYKNIGDYLYCSFIDGKKFEFESIGGKVEFLTTNEKDEAKCKEFINEYCSFVQNYYYEIESFKIGSEEGSANLTIPIFYDDEEEEQEDNADAKDDLKDIKEDLDEKINDLTKKIADQDKKINELKQKLTNANEKLQTAKNESNSIESEKVRPAETKLESEKSNLNTATNNYDFSKNLFETAKKNYESIPNDEEHKEEKNAANKEMISAEIEMKVAEENVKKFEKNVETAQKDFDNAQEEYESSLEKIKNAEKDVKDAEKDVKDAEKEKSSLQNEKKLAEANKDKLNDTEQSNKESATLKTSKSVSWLDELTMNELFSSKNSYYKEIKVKISWTNLKKNISDDADINLNGDIYTFKKSVKKTNVIDIFSNKEEKDANKINIFIKKEDENKLSERYFKIEDFRKMFCSLKIKYNCYYCPLVADKSECFFNVPIFDVKNISSETKEAAEKRKNELEELFKYEKVKDTTGEVIKLKNPKDKKEIPINVSNQYCKGELIKIFIDTSKEDLWKLEIEKLRSLREKLNKLPYHYKDDKGEYWYIEVAGINEETKNKKPKLCDKIWPLDFFGVVGFLGLDDLAAKFGLDSNVKMCIFDSSNNPMTFEEIEYAIMGDLQSYGLYDDIDGDIYFDEDLADDPNTTMFQFSEEDFNYFKKCLDKIKSSSEKVMTELMKQTFSKKVKVGIADGYFYYPTGTNISFKYSAATQVFKLDGLNQEQSLSIAPLLKAYNSSSYEETVRQWANINFQQDNLNSLPNNVKIFLAYPNLPDPISLIGGNVDSPDDFTEDDTYFYIPDQTSVKKFVANLTSVEETTVKFNVFCKQPMLCKYPKSKDPKCKGSGSEGYCGLEECLKKGINLKSPLAFDLEQHLIDYTIKMKEKELAKKIEQYNKDVQTILDKSKNVLSNFSSALISENEALDTLYDLGKALNPIFRFLPLKCIVDAVGDGRNAICAAQKKTKDRSVAEKENSAFKQTINTISILANDAKDAYANHFKESFKLASNAIDSLGDGFGNFFNGASNLYNWCPRRFGDFIAESGVAKGLQDSLTAVMKTSVGDILKGVLGSCITNGIIDEVTSSINGLTGNAKGEFKNLIESGDIDAIDNFAKQYPQITEKFGNGQGGLDITKLMNESSFNMNIFASIQEEILKRMNPASMVTSAATSFMEPSNLIEFAKKGVTSAISPDQTMGSTIMNSIKGTSLNSVQNQLGTNISTLINTNNSTKGSTQSAQNFLASIQNYYMEKENLYNILEKEPAAPEPKES
jgi:chemotaxis protein histidine kinase CheA